MPNCKACWILAKSAQKTRFKTRCFSWEGIFMYEMYRERHVFYAIGNTPEWCARSPTISIKRRVLEAKEKQVSLQLGRHKKLHQWIGIYHLPHNKTDSFLYVWKSRPVPSFVPAPFSIRPLHSVLFFSKSCWILFEFELVSLFVARWWITGCTFKDACSDAETAKHDFLGFTPLTHAPVVL